MTTLMGVNLDLLPDEYGRSTSGRVLLADADSDVYKAAATVKTVPTGVRRVHSAVLEHIFLADCTTGEAYLTAPDSLKAGRFKIRAVQPYQGHRSSGAKPPLLSAVRDGVWHAEPPEEFTVHLERVVEADDAMMIRSYQLGDMGVVSSDDKDLRMTPFRYYDRGRGVVLEPDPIGQLWMDFTPGGEKKLLGHGLKFFWAQMMMGDSADHIKGLIKWEGKNCGKVTAYNVLHPLPTMFEVSNTVIDGYRAINQNPLPEAWLLWLLRNHDDNAWKYFNELEWTPANRAFLLDCVARPDWFIH